MSTNEHRFKATGANGHEHPDLPKLVYLSLKAPSGHTMTGYLPRAEHAWVMRQLTEAPDTRFERDLSEALNSGDGSYRP